jgi:Ca2+/H+ antiporter, TMEM165/GDT1 family
LRTAGMKAQRNEAAIYSKQVDEMQSTLRAGFSDGLNFLAMTAAFKAVVIEGIEVVFIVVTVGRMAGALVPAALGATAAAIVVVALGLAIHRPLTRVPENALKFGVGVVIVSFGIFWLGEGLGLEWPGGDLAVAAIIAGVFALAQVCAAIYRFRSRRIGNDAPSVPRAGVVGSSSHQF